ncbi:MAG: DUF4153 domain-containing protein [Rhodoblastus sp.]|nr:DUF4153 domain-containing protein [Rhodoblastus sp.]
MNESQSTGWLSLDVGRLRTWFAPSVVLGIAAAGVVFFGTSASDTRIHILAALIAAWLTASAASLFAQALRQPLTIGLLAQLAGGGLAAAGVWFDDTVRLYLPLFYAALVIACLAAPLPLLRDADSYWVWCEKVALATLLAGATAGAGALAMIATFWSADQLFGIGDWLRKRYAIDALATFFLAVGPAVFLAILPPTEKGDIGAGARDFVRRAAMILSAWALTPFVLIYSALLWAYAGKIAFERALPYGQIGWMVGLFGLTSLGTVLLIYPQRASGPARVRLLWRIWPFLAIAPLALLAFALRARLESYGLTPPRYIAILLAALCAACALVAYGGRERIVRFAPAAAALALLVASFGPWGARGASSAWQAASLRTILAAHGLIRDGRIAFDAPAAQLTEGESGRWKAARAWLVSQKELRRIAPDTNELTENKLTGLVRLRQKSAERRHFHFSQPTDWTAPSDLARFVLVGAVTLTGADGPPKKVGGAAVSVSKTAISVTLEGRAPALFEFERIAQQLDNSGKPPGSFVLRATTGHDGVALLPETLTMTYQADGSPRPGWIRVQIFARQGD